MFGELKDCLTVKGTLVALTGLRIGTGRATATVGTDLPVLRNVQGEPFIPGSSLKGVLRSYLEALVRGMVGAEVDPGLFACDPTNEESRCISSRGLRQLKQAHVQDDAGLTQAVWEHSCLLCRTFGSSGLASHVQIQDAPVLRGQWAGQFEVRDGVAIDRDKGTAVNGKLYDYEVVPAGTPFALELRLDNPESWQSGLIWLGIRALEKGEIAVGGFTTRGLGWMELQEVTAHFTPADQLLNRLAGGASTRPVDAALAQSWVRSLRNQVQAMEGNHA